MERINQEAFITTPNLRSHPVSEIDKKRSLNFRQKILVLLRGFTDKQLVFQAINNIGIPKYFIDIKYVQSRPDQQMIKIYSAVTTLKKQLSRLSRYSSDKFQLPSNFLFAQSSKKIQESTNQSQLLKSKDRNFIYLKKQIEPQQKIKQAIQTQLQSRNRLQKRIKKQNQSQKIKKQLLEKKKQVAKHLNKKALEIYQQQKQKQERWFQQIQKNNLAVEVQQKKNGTSSNFRSQATTNSTKRNQNTEMLRKKLFEENINFEQYFQEDILKRKEKDLHYKEFKHRRMNSLNQKVLYKQLRSQQIRQRKINTYQEDENDKLKKWLLKQIKIKECRSPNRSLNENRDSESIQGTSVNLMTTTNLFRSNTSVFNPAKNQTPHDDEKQNIIFQKIFKKNEKRQMMLQSKVERIRQNRQKQEQRRQMYKQSQLKLLTEISCNNDTFIHQKGHFSSQIQQENQNPQQQNIKKTHQNILANISCEQVINKLKKLPKVVLEKKLKEFKNKQLNQILAQNICQFFN